MQRPAIGAAKKICISTTAQTQRADCMSTAGLMPVMSKNTTEKAEEEPKESVRSMEYSMHLNMQNCRQDAP